MDNFHFTSYSNTKSVLNGDVIDDKEIKIMFDGNDLDLFIKENDEFAYERFSKDEIIDIISQEPNLTLENLDKSNTSSLLKKLELDFPIKTVFRNSVKTKKTKKKDNKDKNEKKDKKDKKNKKTKKKNKTDKVNSDIERLDLIDTIF